MRLLHNKRTPSAALPSTAQINLKRTCLHPGKPSRRLHSGSATTDPASSSTSLAGPSKRVLGAIDTAQAGVRPAAPPSTGSRWTEPRRLVSEGRAELPTPQRAPGTSPRDRLIAPTGAHVSEPIGSVDGAVTADVSAAEGRCLEDNVGCPMSIVPGSPTSSSSRLSSGLTDDNDVHDFFANATSEANLSLRQEEQSAACTTAPPLTSSERTNVVSLRNIFPRQSKSQCTDALRATEGDVARAVDLLGGFDQVEDSGGDGGDGGDGDGDERFNSIAAQPALARDGGAAQFTASVPQCTTAVSIALSAATQCPCESPRCPLRYCVPVC